MSPLLQGASAAPVLPGRFPAANSRYRERRRMATLEIYTPKCEEEGCAARATRRITLSNGTEILYCAKHAGSALLAASKAEKK